MAYSIVFKESAIKQLRSLPKKMTNRLAVIIDALADNPRPLSCKKLQGTNDAYRIRTGDYRVIYTVDDQIVTVEIVKIGNRKDVYK
jgi:mRNA interferase RelE/StbE